MNNRINITLDEIKSFLHKEDCRELYKSLKEKVSFDYEMYSRESRWNYTSAILNLELDWICFAIMQMPWNDSSFVRVGTELTGLALGSTDDIILQLEQNQKNIINGRKHFYTHEQDFGAMLVVYEPITFEKFLENELNVFSSYVSKCIKSNQPSYVKQYEVCVQQMEALLKVLS